MKETRATTLNIFLVLLLLVSLAVNGFLYLQNKRLARMVPRVWAGKVLPELELRGVDNTRLAGSSWSKGVYLLLIFKNACLECSQNLAPWRNLVHYGGNRIRAVGIIPDGELSSLQFQEGKNPNFPLYLPEETLVFSRQMQLDGEVEYTVLVQDQKIVALLKGVLTPQHLEALQHLIGSILKKSEG